MKPQALTHELLSLAALLARSVDAEALLLALDGPMDWEGLKDLVGSQKLVIVADRPEQVQGAAEAGLPVLLLDMAGSGVHERLTQALLESVADDILTPGAEVIAVYGGFQHGGIDSISKISLDERLRRLSARDLRQLETRVPLETLKTVVDLAVEIGREGREGKPVGALFVVGDSRKVMAMSHPVCFDPVKGYSRKERSIHDPRVREAIKEIAQLDGAMVVSSDGVIEAAARYIDAPAAEITLSKGLGSRHWAAAAISRTTKAVSIATSESNGTVRIFQGGEVVLRIEPFHRAMKWREFEYEPPAATD